METTIPKASSSAMVRWEELDAAGPNGIEAIANY
jgi:hypothetical protein